MRKTNKESNLIYKHLYKLKIKINSIKTELMIFTRKNDNKKKKKKKTPKKTIKNVKNKKQKISDVNSIFIENVEIKPKTNVKYLGVYLDKLLNFDQHITHTHKKAYIAFNSIYNLINRRSSLNIKNKLLIFKMIIRPIMTYAAPIWSNVSISKKKLEVIQSKILRMIAMEPPGTTNVQIRKKFNIESLRDHIIKLTRNFYKNQVNHIDCIKDLGKMNHENAPFKIRYKLPHQVLLKNKKK